MNYNKTKLIINKKIAMERSGFFKILLLFFLILTSASCLGESVKSGNSSKANTATTSSQSPHKELAKKELVEFIGGWGPCGYHCLLDQIIENAVNLGKTKQRKKDQSTTYLLPNSDKSFTDLMSQEVVGNEKGRKWFRSNKTSKKIALKAQGVSGKMKDLAQALLIDNTKGKVQSRFFVVAKFMEFSEKVQQLVNKNVDENAIIVGVEAAFEYFQQQVAIVKDGSGKSINIFIPGDKNAENGGLIFEEESAKFNSSKRLSKDATQYVDTLSNEVKDAIEKFKQSVK